MNLKDLSRDVYLSPTEPITCCFEGFRFHLSEPMRQLCKLSDGETKLEIVLATAATIAPGLKPGDAVKAMIGIRMSHSMARIEVLSLQQRERVGQPKEMPSPKSSRRSDF